MMNIIHQQDDEYKPVNCLTTGTAIIEQPIITC